MTKMVGTREHSTVLEGDRAGRSRARQPEVPVSSGGGRQEWSTVVFTVSPTESTLAKCYHILHHTFCI